MNTFMLGSVTSSGLSDIVSFFNNQSSSGDVSGALGTASIAFKIAMFVIMFIGAIAMAIWIGRIGVDILLIVLRGTKWGDSDKIKALGTGKEGSHGTVGSYLKGNLLEIILVIVLIVFLMTGWLFRLIAIALSGFGALGNKLFGLDIEGTFTAVEAQAYAENLSYRRSASLKGEYDEQLGALRAESERLYEISKKGTASDDPKFQRSKRMYSMHMARAILLAKQLEENGAITEFKLDKDYFKQHLRQRGNGVCNKNFVDTTIIGEYTATFSDCSS